MDVTFWGALGDLKLHELKLSEEPIAVSAIVCPNKHTGLPGPISLTAGSLSTRKEEDMKQSQIHGHVYCFNTIENMISFDKIAASQPVLDTIFEHIVSGRAEHNPELLNSLILLAHCDLKSYKYTFRVGFPAFKTSTPFIKKSSPLVLRECMKSDSITTITSYSDGSIAWLYDPNNDTCYPLNQWKLGRYLVFMDSSSIAGVPGWFLRNALHMAAVRWKTDTLNVIGLRLRGGQVDASASYVYNISLPAIAEDTFESTVWWEKSDSNNLFKVADLGAHMDPEVVCASAIDLNLSLMKWRAAPSLDVSHISSLKCLLLGAGTLGCNVARNLLGWGVRHITIVDNSRVSFSNPVRQSLFTFEDCLQGGKSKAIVASHALKAIFPGVVSEGIEMSIPMPGHNTPDHSGEIIATVSHLEDLIQKHDIVYLLTDTRESRWLPTLLCAAHNKVAITAALGFDTFLVMHHGSLRDNNLGCYFCNDVVAPANSTKDRAMDQQCTVARPGLTYIASALAVELTASIDACMVAANGEGALGAPPHMIRGQLHDFNQFCLSGKRFSQCTACSPIVLKRYKKEGMEFVVQALKSPNFLEELTGLADLHKASDSISSLHIGEADEEEWEALTVR